MRCTCVSRSMCLNTCALWYVWDNKCRRSLGEPSIREPDLPDRKALEEAFHTFKTTSSEMWFTDRQQHPPSFGHSVGFLWGWVSLSRLWLNLMLECERTPLPICYINVSFMCEMCWLEDKMKSEMTVQTPRWEKAWDVECCGWAYLLSVTAAAVVPPFHP